MIIRCSFKKKHTKKKYTDWMPILLLALWGRGEGEVERWNGAAGQDGKSLVNWLIYIVDWRGRYENQLACNCPGESCFLIAVNLPANLLWFAPAIGKLGRVWFQPGHNLHLNLFPFFLSFFLSFNAIRAANDTRYRPHYHFNELAHVCVCVCVGLSVDDATLKWPRYYDLGSIRSYLNAHRRRHCSFCWLNILPLPSPPLSLFVIRGDVQY